MHSSIYFFESFSEDDIKVWVEFNETALQKIETEEKINRVNSRLLSNQIKRELHEWQVTKPHHNSLMLYASLISSSLRRINEASFLLSGEKEELTCVRLNEIKDLAKQASNNLKSSSESEIERGVKMLTDMVDYIQSDITLSNSCSELAPDQAINAIKVSITHAQTNITKSTNEIILGKEEYDRRLKLYTDSDLTHVQLEAMALEEIEETKKLILITSKNT